MAVDTTTTNLLSFEGIISTSVLQSHQRQIVKISYLFYFFKKIYRPIYPKSKDPRSFLHWFSGPKVRLECDGYEEFQF